MKERRLPRCARNDFVGLPRPDKSGFAMTSEVRVEEYKGEGYYLSFGQFMTFLIASVRLSLVTRSTSTSGWRLISS